MSGFNHLTSLLFDAGSGGFGLNTLNFKTMDIIKSITFKHVTGVAILILFSVVIYSLAFREIPEGNREIFVHTLGIVEGAVITIVTYYYGSSSGSKRKTDLLEDELDKKSTPGNQ